MARVTVEDCLAQVPNRFALTILGSRRARALGEGRGRALVECDNKEGVTALREIAGEHVRFKEDVDSAVVDFIEEQRRQLRVTAGEHTFLEAASLRALEGDDMEDEEEDSVDVEELQPDPEVMAAKSEDDDDTDEATPDGEFEEDDESSFSDDDALPDEAADADTGDLDDEDGAGDEDAAADSDDD